MTSKEMSKNTKTSIQMIADYEGDVTTLFNTMSEGEVPILATRNLVVFPGVITPILIGRQTSLNLVKHLQKDENITFAIFCQKNSDIDNPQMKDLYEYGVFAKLVRVLEMPGPGNNVTVIVQALGRCRLEHLTSTRPFMKGQCMLEAEEMPEPPLSSVRSPLSSVSL